MRVLSKNRAALASQSSPLLSVCKGPCTVTTRSSHHSPSTLVGQTRENQHLIGHRSFYRCPWHHGLPSSAAVQGKGPPESPVRGAGELSRPRSIRPQQRVEGGSITWSPPTANSTTSCARSHPPHPASVHVLCVSLALLSPSVTCALTE